MTDGMSSLGAFELGQNFQRINFLNRHKGEVFEEFVREDLFVKKFTKTLVNEETIDSYYQMNTPVFDRVDIRHIVVENKPPEIVQNPGRNPRVIRESDLPHHFQNPTQNPNNPQTAPGSETPAEEPEAEPEILGPGNAKDLQLLRALELLKSWAIFQGTQQRATQGVR